MHTPVPLELEPYRTADGSITLRNEALDVFYHSVHGAVNESTHVFIMTGLNKVISDQKERGGEAPIDILEVGLGTGLNLLLTWIRCLEGKCRVNYTALEPFPITREQCLELAYWDELGWPGLRDPFLEMMSVTHRKLSLEGGMNFIAQSMPVQDLDMEEAYDLIYFDAFGPRTQPELWTVEVFENLKRALRPAGVLVTYCAKGQVRRNMIDAGLFVERLAGPPGKRHMLRGLKL